jgi:hypothetical protein
MDEFSGSLLLGVINQRESIRETDAAEAVIGSGAPEDCGANDCLNTADGEPVGLGELARDNRNSVVCELAALGMGGAAANQTSDLATPRCEFARDLAANEPGGTYDKNGHWAGLQEEDWCGVSHRQEESATAGGHSTGEPATVFVFRPRRLA